MWNSKSLTKNVGLTWICCCDNYHLKSTEKCKVKVKQGDRGSTVVKVLCYTSEGRWFDPSWCQWIFH